jgi:hypothetical protein
MPRPGLIFEDEICWTPPTLWQGRLFVRSPSLAVCLYIGQPEHWYKGANWKAGSRKASWHFDGTWMVSRERDFPNDAFTWEELTLWFVACVIILGGAALMTGLTLVPIKRFTRREFSWPPFLWSATFILGFLGPNLFSSLFDTCLFTWPVFIYAALHVTMPAYCRAGQHSCQARARWLARFAVVGLILVSVGYYELCKTVGMFIAWSFLFGFLPCFPLTYLAALADIKKQKTWLVASSALVAFAVFFWSCPVFLMWKSN